MRHLAFLKYVLRHKWFVFWECLRLGVPMWRAILHDLDKFSPDVWFLFVDAFGKGTWRRRFDNTPGVALATQRHYRRSLHHWQSWLLKWDQGDAMCIPMPDTHRREMLADWTAAGKANGRPDITEWYYQNVDNIHVHAETREWLERELANEYYRNGNLQSNAPDAGTHRTNPEYGSR